LITVACDDVILTPSQIGRDMQAPIIAAYTSMFDPQYLGSGWSDWHDKALVEKRCAAKFDSPQLKGKNSTPEGSLSFTGYIYSTVVDTEPPLHGNFLVCSPRSKTPLAI
jgi:hypothetical protein